MTDLKPCPFCGSEAETWDGAGPWHVVCTECGTTGSPCLSEAEAIAAWNTRHKSVFVTGTTVTTDGEPITYTPTQTCENVGYYIDGTRFKCSECGYNGWTKWAKDGEDRIPNYCPNCGCKVVDA